MNTWMFIALMSLASSAGLIMYLRQIAQERSELERQVKVLAKAHRYTAGSHTTAREKKPR